MPLYLKLITLIILPITTTLPGLTPGTPPSNTPRPPLLASNAAATIAHGMRADVTIMDLDLKRLAQIDQIFGGNVKTLASSGYEIEKEVMAADLVVGAVLVHGAKAPKLVSNALVKKMKPGAVLVDVAIDQGGCFEDSKATTHDDPTYKIHNSIFYCVANMPGSVPNTSTYALTNVTMPYAKAIANKGWKKAIADDKSLRLGLNVHEGLITYKAVADAFNLEYTPAEKLISA